MGRPVQPRPHVSAALSHLRHGAIGAALTLAGALLTHLLVFGFVHYTDVRHEDPPRAPAPIAVVGPGVSAALAAPPLPRGYEAAPTPRALSAWDPALHVVCDVAGNVGVLAAGLLALFATLGAAIGGGISVPGIERVVSAATWAWLLAAAAVPWGSVFPNLAFPGLFWGYEAMVRMSSAVDAGAGSTWALLSAFALSPLAGLAACGLAVHRFLAGVAEGIIVTSVSELDERLEKEMATIARAGVSGPPVARAVAALNQAIGERPAMPPVPPAPASAPPFSALRRLRPHPAPGPVPPASANAAGKRPI